MNFYQARAVTLRDQTLLKTALESIRPVPLYVLLANRNAWHSTPSSRYRGASGLFGTAAGAKSAAEDLRKPGTWFRIMEVPSLAIRGGGRQWVTTEFHSRSPYGAWRSDRGSAAVRLGTPMGTVMSALGKGGSWRREISGHSFISGRIDYELDAPMPATWAVWTSAPKGPDRCLDWTREAGSFSAGGVQAVREAFRQVNGPGEVDQVEQQMTSLPVPDYLAAVDIGL